LRLLEWIPDSMRVVAAGVLIWLAVIAVLNLLGENIERIPPWIGGGGMAALMIGLCLVFVWLFNLKGSGFLGGKTAAEHIGELERLGLVADQSFRAVRAFGVEEYEDEGLHYFLELEDGRVLFLSGQYLYDYEPILDSPEQNCPRRFPCTEFTVRRHRVEGYVVDLVCGGVVLAPETMARPFDPGDMDRDRFPGDGTLIADTDYESLKRERLGQTGSPSHG
jgi:hypothetical protein